MGGRNGGRKPIPASIHILNGNPSKKPPGEIEAAIAFEKSFIDGIADIPDDLSEEALREWRRIVPEFEAAGILKTVDRTALSIYCSTYARWIEAQKRVDKEGMMVTSENGFLILNPYLKVVSKCLEQLKYFLSEFGMTPASRVKIRPTNGKTQEDPLDEFIRHGSKKSA